jgi:hypothetical protein
MPHIGENALFISSQGTLGTAAYTAASSYALVAGSTSQSFSTLTLSASGLVQSGVTGTAGMLKIARASDGLYVGTDTMNGNIREVTNQAGDIVWIRGATEKLRINAAGALAAGTFTVTGAFGCNGSSAQTAVALGAASTDLATVITLANNIRTALIANGIGS